MPVTYTTMAGAKAIINQFKENLTTNLKGLSDYISFQASHNIHQRALRYNPNTIVTYPKTPRQQFM